MAQRARNRGPWNPPPGRPALAAPWGRPPRGGALSSAILYVAIVVIWAAVLIPRWLRRDSSSSSGERAGDDLTTAEPDSAAVAEPAPRSRRRGRSGSGAPGLKRARRRPGARPEGRPQGRPGVRSEERSEGQPEAPAARREAPAAARGAGQEHKGVLTARRRLLGLLVVLAIGSGALAVTKLAAWWVVVPPSVMLLGYVVLLREAAQADAERQELARTRAAAPVTAPATAAAASRPAESRPAETRPAETRPAATSPAAMSSAAVSSAAVSSAAVSPAAVSSAAGPAAALHAEVIDISASLGPVGEEPYDQYADAKLRAVGDLARPHLQHLRAPERDVRVEGETLIRRQPQVRVASG